MNVYVALYHNSGSFVSWGISLFTRSDYSHVELWFPEEEVVVSADSEGVVAKSIPKYGHKGLRFKNREVDLFYVTPPLSNEKISEVYSVAMSFVGHKYDYLMTFLGFPLRLGQPKSSETKLFCSELVIQIFRMCSVDILKRARPYEISPRDVSLSSKLRFKKKVYLKKK